MFLRKYPRNYIIIIAVSGIGISESKLQKEIIDGLEEKNGFAFDFPEYFCSIFISELLVKY